ncbi:unnamed protein product, partial [Closterium sp. NIES-53]
DIRAGVPDGMGADHRWLEWRESRVHHCHWPHMRRQRIYSLLATPQLQALRTDSKLCQQPQEDHLSRSFNQPAARKHPCNCDCTQPAEIL